MTTPAWQAATLYVPGFIVRPASAVPSVPVPLPNGSFTANADGWVLVGIGTGVVTWSATGGFDTPGCVHFEGTGEANDGTILLQDAVPVVHGRWIKLEDGFGGTCYMCSRCAEEWALNDGAPTENNMYYCPQCGAKMDEEETDR